MFNTQERIMQLSDDKPHIALVGPCGVGKSTLSKQFCALGFSVQMPTQEHSGIPDLWRRRIEPDYLIALDAPNEVLRGRRPGALLMNDAFLAKERLRLAHAFAHADLKLDTSTMSIEETVQMILAWLKEQKNFNPHQ